jgi:hypothetical protein
MIAAVLGDLHAGGAPDSSESVGLKDEPLRADWFSMMPKTTVFVPKRLTRSNKMPNRRRSTPRLLLVAVLVASFSVVPAAALAQDPLSDPSSAQYNAPIPGGNVAGTTGSGVAGEPASGVAGEPAAAGQATPGGGSSNNLGSLPFTGMDLIIVAGVALLLTGTGVALRRLSVPREPRV